MAQPNPVVQAVLFCETIASEVRGKRAAKEQADLEKLKHKQAQNAGKGKAPRLGGGR